MAKTEARKVYELPSLVEIGSMAEITEYGPGNRHHGRGRGHENHGRGFGLGHHKNSSHDPDS